MTSKRSKGSLKSKPKKLFRYSGNDFENPISDKLVDDGFKKKWNKDNEIYIS